MLVRKKAYFSDDETRAWVENGLRGRTKGMGDAVLLEYYQYCSSAFGQAFKFTDHEYWRARVEILSHLMRERKEKEEANVI